MPQSIYQFTKKESALLALLKRIVRVQHFSKVNRRFAQEKGRPMAVYAHDHIGLCIYTDGFYERELLEAAFEFLRPALKDAEQACALDVGANIGNHAIFFAKYFKQIHAFEANPFTFQLLKFNAQFHDNIIPYDFGLGERTESLPMYEVPGNYGASSASHKTDNSDSGIAVKIRRLDDMQAQLSDVYLVKVDVEGMEYAVLKGGLKIVTKNRPIILFEQHSADFSGAKSGGGTKVMSLLKELGYRFCWLEDDIGRIKSGVLPAVVRLMRLFCGTQIRINIVTGDTVPKRRHSFIIAIPPALLGLLHPR